MSEEKKNKNVFKKKKTQRYTREQFYERELAEWYTRRRRRLLTVIGGSGAVKFCAYYHRSTTIIYVRYLLLLLLRRYFISGRPRRVRRPVPAPSACVYTAERLRGRDRRFAVRVHVLALLSRVPGQRIFSVALCAHARSSNSTPLAVAMRLPRDA